MAVPLISADPEITLMSVYDVMYQVIEAVEKDGPFTTRVRLERELEALKGLGFFKGKWVWVPEEE